MIATRSLARASEHDCYKVPGDFFCVNRRDWQGCRRDEARRGEGGNAASDFNRNGNLSVSHRKIDSSSNERVILGVRTYVRTYVHTYVGEEGQSRLNTYTRALSPVGVLREICMLIYSARPVRVCVCVRTCVHARFAALLTFLSRFCILFALSLSSSHLLIVSISPSLSILRSALRKNSAALRPHR